MSKKKAAEAKLAARAAGMPVDDNIKEDVFELQHHHLLRCLEKTTVSSLFWPFYDPLLNTPRRGKNGHVIKKLPDMELF